MSSLPWIAGGDFNEILSFQEKSWGNGRHESLLENFRSALDYFGLKDLGFCSPKFTWSNRRDSQSLIQECLDKCVGNSFCYLLFPFFTVKHLEFWKSDHRPILLEIADRVARNLGGRRFHYESAWAENDGFSDGEADEIQPGLANFSEGSRAFKTAFKSIIKNAVAEDALVSCLLV